MKRKGKIIILSDRAPWPHELRVAEILAQANHVVEFLPEAPIKTADILLNGTKFEIKSPKTGKINTFEHNIKRALKQSKNIIIDLSRMDGRKIPEHRAIAFLAAKCQKHPQIKQLLVVTKQRRIIDIKTML
jgi:hypothetical protein